ncbi:MAG: hypothetical protein ABJB66_07375 [Gemmatimonadaceae bacterium]
MASAPTECLRCKGRMEAGIILDNGTSGIVYQQQWIEGAAETSFWTGLKTKGHAAHKVVTYRCASCGVLESYASDQVRT